MHHGWRPRRERERDEDAGRKENKREEKRKAKVTLVTNAMNAGSEVRREKEGQRQVKYRKKDKMERCLHPCSHFHWNMCKAIYKSHITLLSLSLFLSPSEWTAITWAGNSRGEARKKKNERRERRRRRGQRVCHVIKYDSFFQCHPVNAARSEKKILLNVWNMSPAMDLEEICSEKGQPVNERHAERIREAVAFMVFRNDRWAGKRRSQETRWERERERGISVHQWPGHRSLCELGKYASGKASGSVSASVSGVDESTLCLQVCIVDKH